MVAGETLTALDAIFERSFADGSLPGMAYGLVADGQLIHTDGLGTTRLGVDARPDRDSVFRIASMTKCFTAAAVLSLRDEGRLRLDDPVARWVPDLADVAGPTADSPPITIEHLLTMSAGLPTDDPWGDRQQGLDLEPFAALLRDGPTFAWAPGTRFEYSNLGYGILGRVITNVAGTEYDAFVRARLLEPLGMTATTFRAEEVPAGRLALGYLRRDGAWLEEPADGYGALASMGGVLTSIGDLARWVGGFTDAFPPRDGHDGDHPLSRATRREMQEVRRSFEPELSWPSAYDAPSLVSGGYGYGLFVFDDLRIGRMVGHGGGYPGFGSHMRWHPASGLGVIAFGNARYARMGDPVTRALIEVVTREASRVRRIVPWPVTVAARAAVERLLAGWDDAVAAGLFAMNVELDEPLELRRAAIERLRERHGLLRPDVAAGVESHAPSHLAWWMTGERGRVKVEILLDPERQPLVQALTLTSVGEPSPRVHAIARRLVACLAEPGPRWPADVPLAASADHEAIERGLRAAEARFGPVELRHQIAGDGVTTATWRLRGPRGEVDLILETAEPDGELVRAAFVPCPMEPPTEAV
ncbi:MAG: serine hydrolase domain-containing protein [Chloroflexota bacterium]